MAIRGVDAWGNLIDPSPRSSGLIDKKYKNPTLSTVKAIVRTANDMVPSERGANVVTRAEYEALLKRFDALEVQFKTLLSMKMRDVGTVTRNASVTDERNAVTPNSNANAERQRRYRERKRSNNE